MLTKTALAATGLVVLLASPAVAAGGTGPFTGNVRQGQTKVHTYDNNPLNQPCIQIVVDYTVTLTYAPATDVLTLSVGSLSATGQNGVATLTFQRSYCTSFDIAVTGTSVERIAQYTVTVTRGNGAIS